MDRFILVKTTDNFGMGGSNCAELYCTILKDGSLSLRECINQYEYGRFYFKAIRGIRTPSQFVEAFESTEAMREISEHDILVELFNKLPYFSIHTAIYIRCRDSELGEDLFNKTYPLIKNVVIELPNEFTKAISIFDVIYNYVNVWIDKHQSLPSGEHQILNYVVPFPTIKTR